MKFPAFLSVTCCLLVGVSAFAQTRLGDYSVYLEDGADHDIVALFEGPSGTPHDFAVTSQGPLALDVTGLPPDNYRLILHSPGYAAQTLSLTYRDGTFVVTGNRSGTDIILFRTRWVTVDIVWNTKASRELSGEHARSETFAASEAGLHPVLRHDYRFRQTTRENPDARKSGPDMTFRRHRFNNFFGVSFPKEGQSFETADMAPPNDWYQRDPFIPLEEGSWFFLRIAGDSPSAIAYVKIRVRTISLEPPDDVEVIREQQPRWARAWKRADDIPDKLRIMLPE